MEEKKSIENTKRKHISLFVLLAIIFFAASGIVWLIFALNGSAVQDESSAEEEFAEAAAAEQSSPGFRVVGGVVEYFDGETWLKTESLETFLADDPFSSVSSVSVEESILLPPDRSEGDVEKPKKTSNSGGSSGSSSSGGGASSVPAVTPDTPPVSTPPASVPESGGLVDTGAEESGDYL